MKKPHVHADIIKAWADGEEIEFLDIYGEWKPIGENPQWFEMISFRIKPEPKPDVVVYPSVANSWEGNEKFQWFVKNKLKLTFDGETGKLKSAEVL